MTSSEPVALTIADAARAAGTGRHLIRTKLQAGAFPNAAKDEQGFWRIPESDLRAAGVIESSVIESSEIESSEIESSVIEPSSIELSSIEPGAVAVDADLDETARLRIEVIELRGRAERAEALLVVERRLSEERARTLETERATIEAMYYQITGARPTPKAQEPVVRPDWQANMRAARARDLEQRAARDREAPRQRESGPETVTVPETGESTDTGPDRRGRWRKR